MFTAGGEGPTSDFPAARFDGEAQDAG